jgi:hypothetical protein
MYFSIKEQTRLARGWLENSSWESRKGCNYSSLSVRERTPERSDVLIMLLKSSGELVVPVSVGDEI